MDVSNFEFRITKHAYARAWERGIRAYMIEATLKGGQITRYGKNRLEFCKKYRGFAVICIGEIRGDIIFIVTIEVGK